MRRVLATELGERLYRKRSQTVAPRFGHTKHNRAMDHLHRRGRSAVRTEWRLITATQNLMKLHIHTLAAATAQIGPQGPCHFRSGPISSRPHPPPRWLPLVAHCDSAASK